MKLEQTEKSMLFSQTDIPDIFFTEYMSQMPGDFVKVYLQMLFLSKYNKDIKINDLSKLLSIPYKTIEDAIKYFEEYNMVIKKGKGYVMTDLQESALHQLYKPNLTLSPEKIETNAKNKSRAKVIDHISDSYFQGSMGPLWYNQINLWFDKYNFDDQVMIALFEYCRGKNALHKNYVQAVAEAWGAQKIRTWSELEKYDEGREKLVQIKKTIAKKLGKRIQEILQKNKMTQKELAERICLTEAGVSRYISGDREPNPEILANIATALHTTSDFLLGIENEDEFSNSHIIRLVARNASSMSPS